MAICDIDACLLEKGEATVVAVLVQPRASKNSLCGLQGDELKVRLTSPPVDGAANKLCCEYFAKLIGCSKRSVSLLSGHKSRHKRLLVEGVCYTEVRQLLSQALKLV